MRDGLLARSESDFDDVMNINLKADTNMIRFMTPAFVKTKSEALLTLQYVSYRECRSQTTPQVKPESLLNKTVAKEIGSRGLPNAAAPGYYRYRIYTSITFEKIKRMGKQIPVQRFRYSKDIAEACVFLAVLKYVAMYRQLNVNGGLYM